MRDAVGRINVDDEWWTDPRREALGARIGIMMADAVMLRAWRLSQEYWSDLKRRPVPSPKFKSLPNWEDILAVGLARSEESGDFFYVCGSKSRHEWRNERTEAGQKGGDTKSRNHREKTLANSSKLYQTVASPSPSPSSSEELNTNTPPVPSAPGELGLLIEEWGKTLRYFGITKSPSLDDLQIRRLARQHGYEKTYLAIRGARHEAKTERFDPGRHLSIRRIARPDNFEKFVNLGSRNRGASHDHKTVKPLADLVKESP